MQTLVYENYSKFIDATDAIKSIGVNVSSISGDQLQQHDNNEGDEDNTDKEKHGLQRLTLGMERIQAASIRSEQLLHASREAVAEKLRIQRLLTRLDALLSLPQTLRDYIKNGKYRMAVSSHTSATEILGRHSSGFESLRSIELECGVILTELVENLKDKLLGWSGSRGGDGANWKTSSLPPKSIAEIFECAGTLLMLYPTSFSSGLNKSQCQSLALAACGQFLRERLVEHTSTTIGGEGEQNKKKEKGAPAEDDMQSNVVSGLPLSFLDGMLESTTLYGVSFPTPEHDNNDAPTTCLGNFVTSNFDKFINHVYNHLIQSEDDAVVGSNKEEEKEDEEAKDDANFLQVSIALSHLLRSVRELASGLALPEVGLDVSIASTLVDQTVELAEMLVRRHVAMKFHRLRGVVVTDCLAPLVSAVVEGGDVTGNGNSEGKDDTKASTLGETIQLANVALSDGLQMADDLIRATLQRSHLESDASASPAGVVLAPVDSAVVKLAVQREAKLFGVWLASSLEQLVGSEPSTQDDNHQPLLEVWDEDTEDGEKDGHHQTKKIIIPKLEQEDSSSFSRVDSSTAESSKYETSNLVMNLIVQLDEGASERAYTNFLLAVCEMCRLAERSMANTLNQSIKSAMEEDARVTDSAANTLFGDSINPHRKGKDVLDSEQILSRRFQLAASRALAMYVMNRGAYAAAELCTDMYCLSDARDPYAIPSRPREACLKVFEIVKASCEDCISIVGGDLFVAPVPSFPDEVDYVDAFGDRLTGGGGTGGASSGLQLDVERMFIEKIQAYSHSLDKLEFTRNGVVSGILRVALSAFLECVRSSVVSSLGYRQLKVDAVFLRYIIPHFVKDEFGTPEQNACSCLFNTIDDIMVKAGQRCFDHEVTTDDDYYDAEKDEIFTPYQLIQLFCEADDQGAMMRVSF